VALVAGQGMKLSMSGDAEKKDGFEWWKKHGKTHRNMMIH
jgi:hypothetical protein